MIVIDVYMECSIYKKKSITLRLINIEDFEELLNSMGYTQPP